MANNFLAQCDYTCTLSVCIAINFVSSYNDIQPPCMTLTSSMDGRQAVCPGEVVTYTCTVIQGIVLEWVAVPLITNRNLLQFSSSTPDNTVLCCSDSFSVVQCSDFDYQATLTDVDNVGGGFADMNSTFRFTADAMLNGTVVECRVTILTGNQMSSSTLNIAGEIHMQ